MNIYKRDFIEINNEFNFNLYEKQENYNKSNNQLKAIAFYYPEYINISYYKYFNNSSRKKNFNSKDIQNLIKSQIVLAKKHSIYGFAIFCNIFKNDYYSKIVINAFSNETKFPFFLTWRNTELTRFDKNIIEVLIQYLGQYMLSNNYIKFKGKPILSIENPLIINNRTQIIQLIRQFSKEKIGEIFLIYPFDGIYKYTKTLTQFDAIYDASNYDLFEDSMKKQKIFHYSGIIYKNLILNKLNINISLFRTCYLNLYKYNDYKPEKFYIANTIIFSDKNIYKLNEGFLFVDSWNNYKNGNYLEFDEKFGFSSINSFSKSILNIPFKSEDILSNDKSKTIIAIHIHAYYEDIFLNITRRIELIPLKYDLYISTISKEKKEYLEKCLKNSNANRVEIIILKNKGRDVLPFIIQMRKTYKYYKYICHIHTKKSTHKLLLGSNWSEYIYSNLLGNKEIISEILNNFESNEKLGFIFPEPYYEIIKEVKCFENIHFALHIKNINYMNLILRKIFHKYKVGEKLVFPVGNMFWAKTKAIYQIFKVRLKYPKEMNQTNETIMHAIERIWLFLVKLNGYYYKTIFKHY